MPSIFKAAPVGGNACTHPLEPAGPPFGVVLYASLLVDQEKLSQYIILCLLPAFLSISVSST